MKPTLDKQKLDKLENIIEGFKQTDHTPIEDWRYLLENLETILVVIKLAKSGTFDTSDHLASVLMHVLDRLQWGDPENAISAVRKMIYEALNTGADQVREKHRVALEEIRTTIRSTYEETAIERRKIAERALGYMPSGLSAEKGESV